MNSRAAQKSTLHFAPFPIIHDVSNWKNIRRTEKSAMNRHLQGMNDMTRRKCHARAAAVAAVLATAWLRPAGAQTAVASQADAGSPGSTSLTEIVVTATRRAEAIKDVPISVSSISGAELEERGADNIADFIQEVPGVVLVNRGAGQNDITIRGINANATQISSYQATTVGYYLNDMPLSENPEGAGDVPLFDLQRVEVLRGPQGTLFGEGAPGGVIRYITNQPDLHNFAGAVAAQRFSYKGGADSYNGNLMLNAPLVDGKLAVRLVVDYRKDGGFFNDLVGPTLSTVIKDANSSNTADVRLLLKWQATEDFDANLSYLHQKQIVAESNQGVSPDGTKMAGLENSSWVEWNLYNLTLNWHLPAATLTSSSNYLDQTDFVFYAAPAGPPEVQTQTQNESIHNFVQEFRAVSEAKGPFRWVLGAFYKDRGRNTGLPLNLVDTSGATPVLPFFTIDDIRKDKEYATYGEAEYDVSKRFTVVVGGRWTHQQSDYVTAQEDLASFIFGFPTYTDIGSTSYNIFTPKGSVIFRLTDDWNIYATVSKGFRGPGVKNFYTGGNSTFGAETVLTDEVGIKGSAFDKRLFLAASVYYNDWTNMQIPLSFDAPWMQEITNAGKARTEGVEVETRFAVDEHWQIGGSAAFSESKILDYVVDPALQGNEIGGNPKWTGSMYADARYGLGRGFQFHGRADYTYIGARYNDIFNTAPELESYGLINARLGVEKDSWEVYLFGRNLANKFATYTGSIADGGYSVLAPRTLGVGASTHF
jgi:outer membrane receptor protein involved in Fe transport